jgi:uncharacterized protein with von Willebrand factor type A (vWA) domain
MNGDLVAQLTLFGRALRQRGVPVSLADVADGAAALALVDLFDRDEVRLALRTALKIRPADWDVFELLFREFPALVAAVTSADQRRPSAPGGAGGPAVPGAWGDTGVAPTGATHRATGDRPGYSPEALLRRKPFDQCTADDLAAMERLLARLSRRLATRPGRRLEPTRGRGLVDLRRSFRRAVATRGEFITFARRAPAIEIPRLVLLCDTSGSMDAHSRFLLAFILSLKRVARRTEAFVFSTALTRITSWLVPGKARLSLERLSERVPDWSGGTRIGESLAEFVARHQHHLLNRSTVVVILSDGLDRGDPGVLVEAMRVMRARARRVIWLNPLLGDPRYQPLARGMEAALPFVDHLASAHNLESLQRLLALVAA